MDSNFNPALYDYVGICNIDNEPFDLVYNNQIYARIEPQQAIKLPAFLVEHGLKHLIDRMLNKANIATNNKAEREKLAAKIVVGREVPNRPAPLSEDDRIKAEIEQVNQKSDLDNILEKTKSRLEPVAPIVPVATPGEILLDEDNKPITDAVPQAVPVAPMVPSPSATPKVDLGIGIPIPTEAPIDDTKSAPAMTQTNEVNAAPSVEPTREELYSHAEGVMKMDLSDQKTKDALDKMSIPDLKTTLQWTPPVPAETSTVY